IAHAAPEHARPRLPKAPAAPARRAHGSSPAHRAVSAPAPQPEHRLDLSRLGQDVDSAIASTLRESEYQRVRDPHSMVARYYLASVMRKLERVGEMSYTGTMVGEVTVFLVIGPDGALDSLQVWRSSGNSALDDYAQRIVRMSAPFAPFSDRLERQTMQLKLTVNMLFEGYRDVDVR
nr:TonB family protein [Betaproteobacteria bacterium]